MIIQSNLSLNRIHWLEYLLVVDWKVYDEK